MRDFEEIENIPVVYIAGPYRAATRMLVHQNVRRAEEVGHAVMALGAMPVVPHANTFFMDGAFPDYAFLDGDLALLRRCDAIVLGPGWRESEGCKGELDFADHHGIPDFDWKTERPKFRRWLKRFTEEKERGVR